MSPVSQGAVCGLHDGKVVQGDRAGESGGIPQPDLQPSVGVILHLCVGKLKRMRLGRRQLPRRCQISHCRA